MIVTFPEMWWGKQAGEYTTFYNLDQVPSLIFLLTSIDGGVILDHSLNVNKTNKHVSWRHREGRTRLPEMVLSTCQPSHFPSPTTVTISEP